MATRIMMRNSTTGIVKKGFYGFSWTTLLFGGFPALFRGDFVMGLVFIVLGVLTGGISNVILAFFYNKTYTTKLVEAGYQFADHETRNAMARARLGITTPGLIPSPT